MTKRVAIVQSNYLPWKGYFDLMRSVDQFVLYDEVQYTRRDWRNRNRIKTRSGPRWITVPVLVKGKYEQRIDETVASERGWGRRHWGAIHHAYARAQYFDDYSIPFRDYLEATTPRLLSRINRDLLEIAMRALGITTPLSWSSDLRVETSGKSQRLLSICLAAGASVYVSGPAARAYLDIGLFESSGVTVEWFGYEGYPEYEQLHPPFVHDVSVIDLLFNVGPDSLRMLERVA
jgi:hypothetical protein